MHYYCRLRAKARGGVLPACAGGTDRNSAAGCLEPGSLDLAAMDRRYAEERQRRLDATGARFGSAVGGGSAARTLQYPRLAELAKNDDRFARMLADPHAPTHQDMITPRRVGETVEHVVLGGGFGGLLAAARLREQGVAATEIVVIEKGQDVGGTWYFNRCERYRLLTQFL
jgi:cyclohexanone monooxygenase